MRLRRHPLASTAGADPPNRNTCRWSAGDRRPPRHWWPRLASSGNKKRGSRNNSADRTSPAFRRSVASNILAIGSGGSRSRLSRSIDGSGHSEDSANVDQLAKDFPDIDILVNNAGAIPGGSLLDVSEATWRKAWDLKVFGYVNMCRRFYALMKARKAGVIVNVVGNAADTHDPEYICGVAGNAALTAFTPIARLRQREGRHPRVALSPGPVETDRIVTPDEEEGEGPHRRARTTGRICSSRCRSSAARRRRKSAPRSRSSPRRTPATLRLGRHDRRRPVGARRRILNGATTCRI